MSPELLGAIMLVLMLGAIFIGFPISFTLLLLALIFGWVGLGDRAFYIMVFQTIGRQGLASEVSPIWNE